MIHQKPEVGLILKLCVEFYLQPCRCAMDPWRIAIMIQRSQRSQRNLQVPFGGKRGLQLRDSELTFDAKGLIGRRLPTSREFVDSLGFALIMQYQCRCTKFCRTPNLHAPEDEPQIHYLNGSMRVHPFDALSSCWNESEQLICLQRSNARRNNNVCVKSVRKILQTFLSPSSLYRCTTFVRVDFVKDLLNLWLCLQCLVLLS